LPHLRIKVFRFVFLTRYIQEYIGVYDWSVKIIILVKCRLRIGHKRLTRRFLIAKNDRPTGKMCGKILTNYSQTLHNATNIPTTSPNHTTLGRIPTIDVNVNAYTFNYICNKIV